MTARVVIQVDQPNLVAAIEDAKAQARAEGMRVRTVARVAPQPEGGYRVELSVDGPTTDAGPSGPGQGGGGPDDPPPTRPASWVREGREEALAWRRGHPDGGRA